MCTCVCACEREDITNTLCNIGIFLLIDFRLIVICVNQNLY